MEFFLISLLNGLSYGLLLFLLSSGFTLIFSMMGILNFAHASFYMLGAYLGYSVSQSLGFWAALVIAPLLVGLLGEGKYKPSINNIPTIQYIYWKSILSRCYNEKSLK